MLFVVVPTGSQAAAGRDTVTLEIDDWNDYWDFRTMYQVSYLDAGGRRHDLGPVKIGQFSWQEGQIRPAIPESFERLDGKFFSVGQDDDYYEKLQALPSTKVDEYLRAMRDFAYDLSIFARAQREEVATTSLLREVPRATVKGRFNRLAHGSSRLTPYSFRYVAPAPANVEPLEVSFDVRPGVEPPTNLHVLIGRNGVGKTRLLNGIAEALVDPEADGPHIGTLFPGQEDAEDDTDIGLGNVVSVSFSAFDRFEPLDEEANRDRLIKYSYVGLKRRRSPGDDASAGLKDAALLASEFGTSLKICLRGSRERRWRHAMETLSSDPIFADAELLELLDEIHEPDELRRQAVRRFRRLSSGHSIVLLTITKLVETVDERTLVLIDEPEAHLHPPLLSAFTRALSDLVINRNGVAIVATHSPIVLQEVPMNCVWKIDRSRYVSIARRPEVETFGENVGVLTREVFGLEVTTTGFNKLLTDRLAEVDDYEVLLENFGGALGSEALGLLRAYLAARPQR